MLSDLKPFNLNSLYTLEEDRESGRKRGGGVSWKFPLQNLISKYLHL